MEYTIQKLSRLAGVSTRTLRYYDEIGLLKPAKINSSGYRIYGAKETDQLQLILFYRALDLSLDDIRTLILAPDFDRKQALASHLQSLLNKRKQLDQLITNVENTLSTIEGSMTMTDQEKFEGLKKTLVDENEKTFGAEIRKLYGDKAIDEAHQALLSRSKKEHDNILSLEQEVLMAFKTAYADGAGSTTSEAAHKAARLHQAWLKAQWPSYSTCGHRAIAETYITDARFTAYYDRVQPGLAQFVRDVIRSCIID